MAFSKVIITFNSMPEPSEVLSILETNLNTFLNETFRPNRLGSFQTKIPPIYSVGTPEDPSVGYGGFISNNYKDAFNADYNISSLFTVESTIGEPGSGLGTVTITANYPNAVFEVYDNPTGTRVEVFNEAVAGPYEIIDLNFFSNVENTCSKINVLVTTNYLTKKIYSPVIVNDNIDNPFTFSIQRGLSFPFKIEDENGNLIQNTLYAPPVLSIDALSIVVNNSPNGNTVTIGGNIEGLNVEFSLDGISFQTSNVFSGLLVGEYTLFVRDQYGCVKQKDFEVNETAIYTPHFYYSKANPIRMAIRDNNLPNEDNTLSCEVDSKVKFKNYLPFTDEDIIPTQFKSNYSSNVVTIIKKDGSTVNVPIYQKTNNIGLKDKRDAVIYNLEDGKTGVYFNSGNTYDFDTNVISGTYMLNGALPYWGSIGNYIQIGTAWYLITNTIYDEDKQADVIVFENNYVGIESNVIVGTIYNAFNYEVYEYYIDMALFLDEDIQVSLIATNTLFPTETRLSETISVRTSHYRTLLINYRNETNNDVMFSTGIEFFLRAEYVKINGKTDEESDIHKTDSNVILLNADMYEGDEIIFNPVTKAIWRQLQIALSHEILSINDVGYVKSGNFSTEGAIEDSNLYSLTAELLKTGNVYNSSGVDYVEPITEDIPSLLDTDLGYVAT